VTVSQSPLEPDLTGSDEPDAKSAKGPSTLITDARIGTSAEMSSRVRRYTITMAFRTACFVAMIFVDGPMRWVLFACAVMLPLIAVMAANQAKKRGRDGKIVPAEPAQRSQLTTGEQADVISGSGGSEQESHGKRVA
jgi:hypothetical protein